jgi:hypothetical protein
MTAAPRVWTFFYGSYINFEVLGEVALVPENWEVARVAGFDIRIQPRANLVRSDAGTVYGIVATATHEELARLYAHAQDVLGELLPAGTGAGRDPRREVAARAVLYLPGHEPAAGGPRLCRAHLGPGPVLWVSALVPGPPGKLRRLRKHVRCPIAESERLREGSFMRPAVADSQAQEPGRARCPETGRRRSWYRAADRLNRDDEIREDLDG